MHGRLRILLSQSCPSWGVSALKYPLPQNPTNWAKFFGPQKQASIRIKWRNHIRLCTFVTYWSWCPLSTIEKEFPTMLKDFNRPQFKTLNYCCFIFLRLCKGFWEECQTHSQSCIRVMNLRATFDPAKEWWNNSQRQEKLDRSQSLHLLSIFLFVISFQLSW